MPRLLRAAACGLSLALTAGAAPHAQTSGAQNAPPAASQPTPPGPAIALLLADAERLQLALQLDEAAARAEQAIAAAERAGDRPGLAAAYRTKGSVLRATARSRDAAPWFERALTEFEALGDWPGMASALSGLAACATAVGDGPRARELVGRAVEILTGLGDERDRARVQLQLAQVDGSTDPTDARVSGALAVGQRLQDVGLVAWAARARGAREFGAGDLTAAEASLETAIAASEQIGDVSSLAASYLMLGRIRRAHGDFEGALKQYDRATALLEPTHERYTLVEAVNAKAVALGYLARPDESRAMYQRGLELARESDNPRLVDFMLGNLASALADAGDDARAIAMFEEILGRHPDPYIAAFRHTQLAKSLGRLGRYAEAIDHADESIRITRELNQLDLLDVRLDNRAWILERLGRLDDALAAQRAALDAIDAIRVRLLPVDLLKRGYVERAQQFYARSIDLLVRLGRGAEALELAERGRARAFLDLLASREAVVGAGGARSGANSGVDTAIRSESAATPVSVAEIGTIAARLGSTVVTYWVADDWTVAWVADSRGGVFTVRLDVTRVRLEQLVAATTAPLRPANDARAVSTPAAGTAPASPRSGGQPSDVTSLPLRGLNLLRLTHDDRSAWRELNTVLIEPLRRYLPSKGRLTIVPHGPLFLLSFAALQNHAGRYLIEDYDLHYAPAVSVLDFTGRRQLEARRGAPGPWLLVGDPATRPAAGGRPVPPLPGAARELSAVARLAPDRRVLRLTGVNATESSLAQTVRADRPSVLHFATHGFVSDNPEVGPFLVLQRRGAGEHEDGRLTLDEVHALTLETDLVVLSACRSGTGRVSADGMLGLTRAFVAAGTPSVVATLWDVTDETTAVLIPRFYQGYAADGRKGTALTAAQRALLADLRAGRVVVTVAGRRVTLPEHPLLWAGFVLSGEP